MVQPCGGTSMLMALVQVNVSPAQSLRIAKWTRDANGCEWAEISWHAPSDARTLVTDSRTNSWGNLSRRCRRRPAHRHPADHAHVVGGDGPAFRGRFHDSEAERADDFGDAEGGVAAGDLVALRLALDLAQRSVDRLAAADA